MLTYCLKCKKDTENVNLKALRTKDGRTMLSSKFSIRVSKKNQDL